MIGGESIIASRPLAFELHHFAEIVVYLPARQVALRVTEQPQVLLWQIDAPARGVLFQIAQDVSQLQGDAEVDGVILRAQASISEDLYAHQPRDRGDAVAVLMKLVEGLISVAQQVHLAAVDHLLEILFRHRETFEDAPQLDRDGHGRFARIEVVKVFMPSVQFDPRLSMCVGRSAGARFLHDVVNNVVNRAAEGVNVNYRVPLGLRQEKERIEEVRLDGLRQFAAQVPRALAQMPRCEMNLSGLNCLHAKPPISTNHEEDRGSRIEDRGSRIEDRLMHNDATFHLRSSILDPQPSQRLYQQDDLVGGRDLWPRVQGVVTHLFDAFQNADPAQPGQSQLEGQPPADQSRQRLSAIEQLPRSFDLEFEQRGVTFAESFLPQVIVADPEPGHLILRQVDSILPYVDFHILPKIGELQRRANAIRKAVQALLAVTEQKQDQTADRVRRARAIIEDLVEIGVAPFDHVLLEGRKQVA